jgi:CDP-glycerol glycerophosphotransferase (TagB/SpsB family)
VSDQCDFVVGIAQSFNAKTTWINEGYQSYTTRISNTNIDQFPEFLLDPSACNKIYNASFIKSNDIRFPEDTYCEDVGFIYTAYLLAEKISILPEILHQYRGRDTSAAPSGTQTFTEERVSHCADVYTTCLERYQATASPEINDLFQARAVIRIQRFFNRMKNVYPDSRSYLYEVLREFFLKISPQIIAENAGPRFAIPFFMIRQGCFPHAVALLKTPSNKTALCDFFRLLSGQDTEISSVFFKDFIVYPPQPPEVQVRLPGKKQTPSFLGRATKGFLRNIPKSRRQMQSRINAVRNYFWGILLRIWGAVISGYAQPRIWMIAERKGTSAEENGYIFFEYCQTRENTGDVYFVMEKHSIISHNWINKKNILIKGSYKHLFLLPFTKYLIFNNDVWDIFPAINPAWIPAIKKIFLTHGIKLYGPGVYMRNRANNFDAILVSSDKEKQIIKYEWNIKRPARLIVTGLPRFDKLLDATPKKQILFCPTWRKSINQMDHEQFMQSDFFLAITAFLQNDRLLSILKAGDLNLILRTHFNLEKYLHCFKDCFDDRIIIEDSSGSRNLQQALKESMALITDYSSILWDMAYMHRPVILYQFDREAFLAERGLHSFGIEESEMTFARVAKTGDRAVDHLESFSQNGFALTRDEKISADRFFAHRDSDNCKRLYNYLSSH